MLLTTIMFFFLHLHIQYYHTHDGRNNAFWIYAVWSYHLHNKNCFASSDRPIIILCDELVYYYLIDWRSKLLFWFGEEAHFFPRKNWCIPSGYENEDLSAAERRTNIYPLDQKYDICWVDTEKIFISSPFLLLTLFQCCI